MDLPIRPRWVLSLLLMLLGTSEAAPCQQALDLVGVKEEPTLLYILKFKGTP
jgi:hypothetical protein